MPGPFDECRGLLLLLGATDDGPIVLLVSPAFSRKNMVYNILRNHVNVLYIYVYIYMIYIFCFQCLYSINAFLFEENSDHLGFSQPHPQDMVQAQHMVLRGAVLRERSRSPRKKRERSLG